LLTFCRLPVIHRRLPQLIEKIPPIYVLTREPVDDYHREGVAVLLRYDNVEVRYNPALHAKLYVCWARETSEAFALFGSGNLTYPGVQGNIEKSTRRMPASTLGGTTSRAKC